MEEKHLEVSITQDLYNNCTYKVLSQTYIGTEFGSKGMMFWRYPGDEFDCTVDGVFCRLISADTPELRVNVSQDKPTLMIFVSGGIGGFNKVSVYPPSHFNAISFRPNMVLEAVEEYNAFFNTNNMKRIPIKKYLK